MTTSTSMQKSRRWGRKLVILFIGVLGLLILLLAILPYVVSLDSVKGRIEARAERALHRQVDIGRVRLQIFTGLGLGLEQLGIHNPPGWQQPYWVRVGSLSIKVAFWPLLQRKIAIRKIMLSHGDIFLERDAKGRLNYADLMQPKAGKAAPPPPAGGRPPTTSPLTALLVSRLSLQHVNITFVDQMVLPGQAYTTTARDVQVDIRQIALDTPIDIDLSAALWTDGGPNVRLHGRLGPIPASMAFDQTPLDLTFQIKDVSLQPLVPYMGPEPAFEQGHVSTDVTLQGRVGNRLNLQGTLSLTNAVLRDTTGKRQSVSLPPITLAPRVTLNLAQASLLLEAVRFALAPLEATLTGTIRHFTTMPQLNLRFATNTFSPAPLLAQFPPLTAALPSRTDVQGRLQLQGTIKGGPQHVHADARLTVDALSLKSGTFRSADTAGGLLFDTANLQASLQTTLRMPHPPEVSLDLKADRLVFDQVATPTAAPAPPMLPKPTAQPKAPPVNLHGKVAIAAGRIKQLRFQNLKADLALIKGRLTSTQTFTIYGGTFQGRMQADLTQPHPDYSLKVKLADVNVGNLVDELTSVQHVLLGTLNTDVAFTGKGFTWPMISKTLSGTARTKITNLKLTTLDLMPKLALGLQGVSKIAGFSVPARLTNRSFHTLQGGFRLLQGKLHTDDLRLRGEQIEVRAKGFLGLDRSLDFEGTAFLLGSLATALGKRAAFLQDNQGRIQLPFTVRGAVTKPQIALNQTYLINLLTQSLSKKVRQKAGKGLQQLMQNVLPGKAGAQTPLESGREKEETPQERLKNTFKRLFKR